jgi:hypothetical protein
VGFTRDYVREMRRLNDLQAEANSIQAAVLSRQLKADAPSLIATSGGYSATQDRVDGPLEVTNIGGSAALNVTVYSTWGEGTTGLPIAPGETVKIPVRMARADWHDGEAPRATGFRFADPKGGRWRQEPGELPVEDQDRLS